MLLIIFLLLLFRMKNGERIYRDPACLPQNCSQGLRFMGDSYFYCQIQMLSGWNEFKQTNKVLESYENTAYSLQMNPPFLTSVSLYQIADTRTGIVNNPTLNLTFASPKHNSIDTKAILVRFTSVLDDRFADPFYRDNLRYRFFSFPFYKTPKSDMFNPRQINYKCFMGLDDTDIKRIYLVTLTAFTQNPQLPGSSITYHITSYNRRFLTNSSKLTIAVAYFRRSRALHTIFEPLPEQHVSADTFYSINRFSVDNGLIDTVVVRHSDGTYEHIFRDVQEDVYMIEVEVRHCARISPCPTSESDIIIVKDGKVIETPNPPSTEVKIYLGLGIAGGVILLMVLLLCVFLSKSHDPTVCIQTFCPCPEGKHNNIATAIEGCLQKNKNFKAVTRDLERYETGIDILLLVACRFVCVENIKKVCQEWKRRTTTRCSKQTRTRVVCFSQCAFESSESVLNIDECFQWYGGCKQMMEYMQSQCNSNCSTILNFYFTSSQSNIPDTFNSLQDMLDTMEKNPDQGTVLHACPIHFQRGGDVTQPLLDKISCPVHKNITDANRNEKCIRTNSDKAEISRKMMELCS